MSEEKEAISDKELLEAKLSVAETTISKLQKENVELKEKYENINWYFENQKDNFVHKNKIREKLKKLRKEEDRISKLDYVLEPEKAIDSLLLRIGDLEELLEGETKDEE